MIDYENMKYKLGQKVYFMHTSIGWMEGEVTSVNKHMEYMVSGIHPLTEDYMYPTREALVKAQIERWSSMLDESCARPDDTPKEPEECAHAWTDVSGYFGPSVRECSLCLLRESAS